MNPEQFLHRCQTLWHIGPIGSWEGIQRYGFRTAQQLIERAELGDDERGALMAEPRPAKVVLTIGDTTATLRDQEPLMRRKDITALLGNGMTVADWVATLNKRVYMFCDRTAMDKILLKYLELEGAQEVITFSPRKLFDVCRHRIELSAQNTGAIARMAGVQKNLDTFVSVGQFRDKKPAEVTVVDGIDDLSVVAFVDRHYGDGKKEKLAC